MNAWGGSVGIPLLAGSTIYALWRPTNLKFWDWLDYLGANSGLLLIRDYTAGLASSIPPPIIYSAPAGMWMYAMTSAIRSVWPGIRDPAAIFWLFLALSLGLGSEILQLYKVIPGSFDWNDFGFYLFGWIFALLPAASFPSGIHTNGIEKTRGCS